MPNRWIPKLFTGRQENPAPMPTMSKEESRRKLSQCLHLMADRPDGVADISACSLSVIPRDFFHLCSTYIKTDIICSDNLIKDLESGGEIGNLRRIQTFHCQQNLLQELPVKFGDNFPCLVVLNLSDNRLTGLPNSFVNLKSLKVLLLARNEFRQFPSPINQSRNLEELNVAGNAVTSLPTQLGRLCSLKTLTLDVERMIYPTKDTCEKGTLAILESLRKDLVADFSDDSGCDADLLANFSPDKDTFNRYINEDEKMRNAIRRYTDDEGIKRSQLLKFHAAMDEDDLRHADSVYKGKISEQKALLRMLEEQEKTESYLHLLTTSVEEGKKGLAEALREMEMHSQGLLVELTILSEERARQMQSYEKDARADDLLWKNLQTELETSKRQEILSAMKAQLEEAEKSDKFYQNLMKIAKIQVDKVIEMHREEEKRYEPVLSGVKVEQEKILMGLLQDEEVQQEMFRELQLKTDIVHQRIMREMVLLEQELSALSLLEQKQRHQRILTAKNCLQDQRIQLAKFYQKLLEEKHQREMELNAVLRDMQREAAKHEENFWLIQYDRLMENLPKSLLQLPQSEEKIPKKKHQVAPPTPPTISPAVPSVLHLEATCIVCMDRLSTAIFLPCGHICCCKPCGDSLLECPLCRASISNKLTLSQSVEETS